MKLPNAEHARIERVKIVDYLLNPSHPDNGGKARFLTSLGFRIERWETLAAAFADLAEKNEVSKTMESPHGTKYILEGRLRSPTGETAPIRTVWIVDRGRDVPRLVSAYPSRDLNQL